ncbi:MAG: hypothetical protein K0S51_1899 [Bacillales bacterium]|jgi:L-ascorbate metabolism protein UlaG (beta-lactamase superfamily)|nr:hypothetical protein [Bacillales bacterium]
MGTKYTNLDNVSNDKSFKDLRKWMKERKNKLIDLSKKIEVIDKVDYESINCLDFSITWIGHATFLIRMNGVNILTDPVWAKRMGSSKRLVPTGIPIEKLPNIDVVVISHGHYDHLDFGTLRKLKGDPTIYVPIGLRRSFTWRGYKKVIEANWWDSFENGSLKISFVPAQHWTMRKIIDRNTSHWGGWVIEDLASKDNIYFVGDTGYFRGFKEIGERFNIDTVLMPIGAYEPEWFMKPSHINPEDSVIAFLELKAKLFIPMHYGTYHLADDTGPIALERLQNEWIRLNLEDADLKILKIGETYKKPSNT